MQLLRLSLLPSKPDASPNTPSAPFTSRFFHSWIWFGCRSNGCVNSARVRSRPTAANATFVFTPREPPSCVHCVSLPQLVEYTLTTRPIFQGHLSVRRL